jgi:hypothetical protein
MRGSSEESSFEVKVLTIPVRMRAGLVTLIVANCVAYVATEVNIAGFTSLLATKVAWFPFYAPVLFPLMPGFVGIRHPRFK